MKAIIVGDLIQSPSNLSVLYDSIINLKSAEEIRKENLAENDLIIVHNALNTFVGHWDIFDLLSDDKIVVSVWGFFYRLSEEESLIEEIKIFRNNQNWSALKSANQALIAFDFIRRRIVLNSLPNYIQLETTSYCNARCVMCVHYYNGNDDAKHIDNKLIENLSSELGGCYVIALNGMGEPFLHPQIEEIINCYAERQIYLVTNTNLSILTPTLLELINEHFISIEISCDGATKDTFESIRKNLSFETFKQNLMLLKERCPKTEKKINMVIMRQNVHEMCQMIELAATADVSFVSFSNLQPNTVIGDEEESLLHYPHVLNYYCQQAYELARKMNIKISCPIPESVNGNKDACFYEEMKRMMMDFSSRSIKSTSQMKLDAKTIEDEAFTQEIAPSNVPCVGICEWALDRTYIDLLGNVSVCCCRRIFRMGKIDEEHSLESVWNGELYQRLRAIFYSGWLPSCCVNCGLLDTKRIDFLKILDTDKLHVEAEFKKRLRASLT